MADLPVHRFAHEAMATRFEVVVAGRDARYAGEAAAELFREVDRYERLLSRHDPGSDISQINRLRPGETVRVSVEVYECLRLAAGLARATGGAFDVTCGPVLACWAQARRAGQTMPSAPDLEAARARVGMHQLRLAATPPDGDGPREFSVALEPDSAGVTLDLGGIGKGFALDGLRETLRDWRLDNVLVDAGTSTVLALGPGPAEDGRGWVAGVGGEWGPGAGFSRIRLRDAALSGSGLQVKGNHIVDPRSGAPVRSTVAAWVCCESAAVADALSTAFLVFSEAEAEAFSREHPDVWAMTVRVGAPDGGAAVRAYGRAELLP